MFGFLIAGEVNDDAVKLKTFADMVLSKYGQLTNNDLKAALVRDFPNDQLYLGNSSHLDFHYRELRDFQFSIDTPNTPNPICGINIIGQGKYTGFMLQYSNSKWFCSVSDGLLSKATGGAKKLAQVMQKKFDIQNYTKLFNSIRNSIRNS